MDYTEVAVWVPVVFAENVAWHLQEHLGLADTAESAGAGSAGGVVVSEIPAKGPTPEEVAVKLYRPGRPEAQAEFLQRLHAVLDELKGFFPGLEPRVALKPIAEEDWAHSWKQYWHPQTIGERLVIKPSWEPFEASPEQIVIELDPKQAFGTGTHPTTQLCLRALEESVPAHDSPLIFDVGTGSGILAIAAVKLGARHVEACDTDPIAIEATDENIRLNGVADRVALHVGGIETIGGQADVLVVNILAEVVAAIAPQIAERVRPGGDVLASGIIRERMDLVEQAFEDVGLAVLRRETQGEWALIEARKPEDFVIEVERG